MVHDHDAPVSLIHAQARHPKLESRVYEREARKGDCKIVDFDIAGNSVIVKLTSSYVV